MAAALAHFPPVRTFRSLVNGHSRKAQYEVEALVVIMETWGLLLFLEELSEARVLPHWHFLHGQQVVDRALSGHEF